jgi:hypothetical protein
MNSHTIRRGSRRTLAAMAAVAFAAHARADFATFFFAPVGNSYSAFLPPDDPIVGQEIIEARILLFLDVTAGDAAEFSTDILFPIEPFPGNDGALALTGLDLDWSGTGHFEYTETTTRFNGTFIPVRYGAETPGFGYEGEILEGSRIEFEYIPEPGTALGMLLLGRLAIRRR